MDKAEKLRLAVNVISNTELRIGDVGKAIDIAKAVNLIVSVAEELEKGEEDGNVDKE